MWCLKSFYKGQGSNYRFASCNIRNEFSYSHCKVVNHTKNVMLIIFFPITFTGYLHFIHPLHTTIKRNIAYTQNYIAKCKRCLAFLTHKNFRLRRAKRLATLGIFVVKWISNNNSNADGLEAAKSVKINSYVNFISSSGIGTGRVQLVNNGKIHERLFTWFGTFVQFKKTWKHPWRTVILKS